METHLLNRLNSGINTKILLFFHNSFWPSLQILEKKYPNLKLDRLGQETSYMNTILKNYDFIIF